MNRRPQRIRGRRSWRAIRRRFVAGNILLTCPLPARSRLHRAVESLQGGQRDQSSLLSMGRISEAIRSLRNGRTDLVED